VDDYLTPDEYAAITGVAKDEYESRVLAAAVDSAARYYPPGSPEATVEAVRIAGDGSDTSLVILFRIPSRPECLFGRRVDMWPTSLEWAGDPSSPEEDGARCVWFGIGEYIDQGGLVVRKCVFEGITWLR
jgi:hypothetical protein